MKLGLDVNRRLSTFFNPDRLDDYPIPDNVAGDDDYSEDDHFRDVAELRRLRSQSVISRSQNATTNLRSQNGTSNCRS